MAMANTARRALRLAFSSASAIARDSEPSSALDSAFGRGFCDVVRSSAGPHRRRHHHPTAVLFERDSYITLLPIASFKCSRAGASRAIATDAPKVTSAVGEVNDARFKELVLDSDIPVLVDFWAPWCGPCRMIAPVIEELARQYAGKLKCFKLNTDENPDVSAKYAISSIPTIMVFVGGEKKDAILGAVPKSTLAATVDKYL